MFFNLRLKSCRTIKTDFHSDSSQYQWIFSSAIRRTDIWSHKWLLFFFQVTWNLWVLSLGTTEVRIEILVTSQHTDLRPYSALAGLWRIWLFEEEFLLLLSSEELPLFGGSLAELGLELELLLLVDFWGGTGILDL